MGHQTDHPTLEDPDPRADLPSDQHLLVMPLHAITEIHGEPGLRRRFLVELDRFGPSDRDLIERALALATRLHAADRRVREPYVSHLLRTATRILCYYHVDDADVVAAALLHDSVEDHPDDLAGDRPGPERDAALAELAERFNPRVADLVGAVTKPAVPAGRDPVSAYRDHVAASLTANRWARLIKLADFTDNAVGIIHTTGPRVPRMAGKYLAVTPVLRELAGRADTPLDDDARRHVLEQLHLGERRLRAVAEMATS